MDPRLELGLCLLLAHVTGDFVLQAGTDVGQSRPWGRLAGHAGIIASLSFVLAGRWQAWSIFLLTLASHVVIDSAMARRSGRSLAAFAWDQAAHLAVMTLLVWVPGVATAPSFWWHEFGRCWLQALVLTTGAIVCVRGAGVLVGYLVRPYLDELEKGQANPAAGIRGWSAGGRAIGQWERALIFLFMLMNQPAGVGFLVAAKSVFRFGELKDRENRMEAEYITIGTLMSFTLAIGAGWLTARLLGRL
jgi:hypothetical protein